MVHPFKSKCSINRFSSKKANTNMVKGFKLRLRNEMQTIIHNKRFVIVSFSVVQLWARIKSENFI